jgi:photosystem II stability/assembly factor-like uncharacterized protein
MKIVITRRLNIASERYKMKARILLLTAAVLWMSLSDSPAQIWEQTNGPCGAEMFSLSLSPNGDLYAGVQFNGLYRSTDDGNTWFNVGFRDRTITQAFIHASGNIFVTAVTASGSTEYKPYRSTDHGATWHLLNTSISFHNISCWDGDNSGNIYLIGSQSGMVSDILKSTDAGDTWTTWSNIPGSFFNNDLLFFGSEIFLSAHGIYKMINNSWVKCFPNGIETNCITVTQGGVLLAGTNYPHNGVYRSIDSANTWQQVFSAGIENTRVLSIIKDPGGIIFAGSSNGVFKSTDEGLTWTQHGLQNTEVWTMSFTNANIPLAGNEYGVYRWNTILQQWEDADDGIYAHKTMALAINYNQNIRFASTSSGLFRTSDHGNNWKAIWPPGGAYPGVLVYDQIPLLFDDNSGILFTYYISNIYRSTTNGSSWEAFLTGGDFYCLSSGFLPGEIFGGGRVWPSSSFFYSSDYGVNWAPTFLTGSGIVQCIYPNELTNNIFAGTTESGIFRSTDNGTNWRSFNVGLLSTNVQSIAVNFYGDIFVGTNSGVFRSRDQGGNWAWTGLENDTVSALAINSSGDVLAGTKSGLVFKTTNDGETWIDFSTGLKAAPVNCIAIDQYGFALLGTTYEGAFRTIESTIDVELTAFAAEADVNKIILSWTTATELNNLGFEIQRSKNEEEFCTVGFVNGHGTSTEQHNYIYIDIDLNNATYFYRLKQVDNDGSFDYSQVVQVDFKAIYSYELEQNFPNPFNPVTTIRYSIPQKSNVALKVYDILGNEVTTLVNEEKDQGIYTINFDANNLASGLYLYRIQAGSFIETKKMIFLK